MNSANTNLRYICLTQNIGAIDPTQPGITEDVMHSMVKRFVTSVGAFLRSLSEDMAARSAPRPQPADGCSLSDERTGLRDRSQDPSHSHEFDLVVLHLQEIGGKKRNEAVMKALSEAVAHIYPNAGWCSGILMSRRDCPDTFSAMGSVVFVSKRIYDFTSILSFKRNRTFIALSDDPLTYASTTLDGQIDPEGDPLFAGKKFSEAGTSRKGYMLTSLRVGTQVMNFVNIHMYHDEDNRIAVKTSPSEYALRRTRAWVELISDILPLIDLKDPCFIFGDFNCRLDGFHLMDFARSTFSLPPPSTKKLIDNNQSFWDFVVQPKNVPQLVKYDREMSTLLNIAGQKGLELGEMPIHFPPSFTKEVGPHDDDTVTDRIRLYSHLDSTGKFVLHRVVRPNKHERLPAFCDRVVFNPEGLRLVNGNYSSKDDNLAKPNVWKIFQYNSVVFDATDHDCVYLAF